MSRRHSVWSDQFPAARITVRIIPPSVDHIRKRHIQRESGPCLRRWVLEVRLPAPSGLFTTELYRLLALWIVSVLNVSPFMFGAIQRTQSHRQADQGVNASILLRFKPTFAGVIRQLSHITATNGAVIRKPIRVSWFHIRHSPMVQFLPTLSSQAYILQQWYVCFSS